MADNFFADFAIILYLKIVVDIKIYVYLPSWFNFFKCFNPKDVKKIMILFSLRNKQFCGCFEASWRFSNTRLHRSSQARFYLKKFII